MPKAKKITLTVLDKKFGKAFTALEQNFVTLFRQMDQKMDAGFASMDAKFDRLANRVLAIQSDVEDLKPLKSLPERVDSLHGMVEHLLVGSERLEQEYTMITAALRRLEGSREVH